jgi:hypothetical protein
MNVIRNCSTLPSSTSGAEKWHQKELNSKAEMVPGWPRDLISPMG